MSDSIRERKQLLSVTYRRSWRSLTKQRDTVLRTWVASATTSTVVHILQWPLDLDLLTVQVLCGLLFLWQHLLRLNSWGHLLHSVTSITHFGFWPWPLTSQVMLHDKAVYAGYAEWSVKFKLFRLSLISHKPSWCLWSFDSASFLCVVMRESK